jgi:hypothetical protein
LPNDITYRSVYDTCGRTCICKYMYTCLCIYIE